MPWIELSGNDIHYTDTGSGDPIVLVHGHGSAAACWEPIIDVLADRFRVLAYDSYDHGFSSNSDRQGPLVDRATELDEFITKLGLERPVVFGQSMGGMTTLRWAARNPCTARALVICGAGWPLLPMDGKIASALDPNERIWLGVGESFTRDWIEANPVEYARYIRIRSTATAIEAARHPRPVMESQVDFLSNDPDAAARFEASLKAIASPMMLFAGSLEDPAIFHGVQRTHELVPHSRLVIAEGTAHNAYYQSRSLLLESFAALMANESASA